jgi:hypothetical protein
MDILIYIAIIIVSAVITQAMMPKPEQPKPAELSDFDAPTAEEARPIPVVFGTVRVTGPNVLWYGDLYTQAITSSGGKK